MSGVISSLGSHQGLRERQIPCAMACYNSIYTYIYELLEIERRERERYIYKIKMDLPIGRS